MEIAKHNTNELMRLEPGDLVEFKRRVYSHWAVYKGDEEVIHLAGEEGDGLDVNVQHSFTIGGKMFNKAFVRVDNFWDVVAGCKAYKNNSKDRKLRALSGDEIVARALSKTGEIGYNIMFSNCEHFASWCRYNIQKSEQVESFFTGVLVGVATIAAAGLAVFFSGNSERKKEQKQTQ
ncbi:phospholipase A and acyltransferase 2-like [Gigantopelta aegis]|uniref:phospholipase A and acyltransferase 2-like n=1 Tax=Gigantopelta aegis TaxID=1735272 RepID=UPI001B88DC47|nr:phospholipase A and acyltransferase 2-like [Gigantopelta aegis]